jgi:hypothetical protein
MIKLWRFLSISIVVAVCLGLMLVPAKGISAGEPGTGKATFLLPAEVEVPPGEAFAVNVTIYNPNNIAIYSAAVDMVWSTPSMLGVTGIDGISWPTQLLTGWDNATGEAYVSAGGSIANPNITTTNITQCTVHFVAGSSAGVVTLNFTPGIEGETVMYDVNTDDLCNWSAMQNLTVTIGTPNIGTPKLTVNLTSLSFTATEGGENPPAQTLEVCSSGNGVVDWSLTDTAAWLGETPTSGSLGADDCEDVTVSVDAAGMEAGDYSATITITGSAEVMVAVSLHIESTAPVEPVEPANLSVSSVSISPQQVKPGEEVTISFNVANTGGETGSYNAVLYINGAVEDSQSVSVAPGMTEDVIFTVSKSEAGVYDVSIAEQSGQFTVVSAGWFGGGLGTSGIVAIVLIVIAIIVALVFVLRRTRRAI